MGWSEKDSQERGTRVGLERQGRISLGAGYRKVSGEKLWSMKITILFL